MSIVRPGNIFAEDCRWSRPDEAPLDVFAVRRLGTCAMTCILLVVNGCAAAYNSTTENHQPGTLCIGGRVVGGGDMNLRDLLMSRVSTNRWLAGFDRGAGAPLVMLDGVDVGDIDQLITIPSHDVVSIETLDGQAALPEFGPRARNGAVVVMTRRAGDHAFVTESRPLRRCSTR